MNLREELTAESVSHLDLSGFCQVPSGTTVRGALSIMQDGGHNVCLVTAEERLIGIITDRDVLQKIVGQNRLDDPVDEIMTPDPVTVTPDFSAAEALWLMDRKHFRNLPVVDAQGHITGNMTHQAIINFLASRYPTLVLNLPPRPDHYAVAAEGGD